jgi:hypothetical protein
MMSSGSRYSPDASSLEASFDALARRGEPMCGLVCLPPAGFWTMMLGAPLRASVHGIAAEEGANNTGEEGGESDP